jgi:hypothetical protein
MTNPNKVAARGRLNQLVQIHKIDEVAEKSPQQQFKVTRQ